MDSEKRMKLCPKCSTPLITSSLFYQGRQLAEEERCQNQSCEANVNPKVMQEYADWLFLHHGVKLEGWVDEDRAARLSEEAKGTTEREPKEKLKKPKNMERG